MINLAIHEPAHPVGRIEALLGKQECCEERLAGAIHPCGNQYVNAGMLQGSVCTGVRAARTDSGYVTNERDGMQVCLPKRGLQEPDLIPPLREFLNQSVDQQQSLEVG